MSNKPALVVIGGWAMPFSVWGAARDWLNEVFDVYWFELDCSRTLQQWQDYLLENTPESAVWIGWSLGGQLAMQIADTAPERVEKLMLITSTPCFLEKVAWANGQQMSILDNLRMLVSKGTRSLIKRFALLQTVGSVGNKIEGKALLADIDASSAVYKRDVLLSGLDLLEEIDHRDWLSRTDMLVHFILGAVDKVVLVREEDIRLLNENASVTTIEGMGHFPFLNSFPAVASVLTEWLGLPSIKNDLHNSLLDEKPLS